MKKPSAHKILPARILGLLPYVLSAGLALLFLLVWFRFQGLEQDRKRRELQRAATETSRILQQRIEVYGSYLLAAESLWRSSTRVTSRDWRTFLNTVGSLEDSAILEFAPGRKRDHRLVPSLDHAAVPWPPVIESTVHEIGEPDQSTLLALEKDSTHIFQMYRTMGQGQTVAMRIDGRSLYEELKKDFPEGIRVQIFLPADEINRLGAPSGKKPAWQPISEDIEEGEMRMVFHGPYFRYRIEADPRFFELHSGAGQNLYQIFFLAGGMILAFSLALFFLQQSRQKVRAVELARKMARAFRHSRSRQAQVFRKNQTMQLLLEPETGRIVDANEACLNYYGYNREELLSKTVFDINTKPKEEILAAMERARHFGQNQFQFKHRLRNGEIRDVEVYSGPLEFRGRTYLYSIILDITLRKQLERELIQTREAAQAASNAKSAFLANMNHEIRTPLTSLVGMTELLAETQLSDYQKEYLDYIRKSSKALLRIVENVLDASRIESGNLVMENAPFNASALLEEVKNVMNPAAREKGLELRIESDLNPDLILIGDAFRIQQVLLNLVGNAIKFTEKGKIIIEASGLASHPLHGGEGSPPTLEVIRLGVKDTGKGIPSEELNRIFDAFYRARNEGPEVSGSGLGLSICKKIVDLMGSSLRVISQAGAGSNFFFTLQLPSGILASRPQEPEMEKSPSSARRRLLIVEDNPDNMVLVQKVLSSSGYEIDTACDGKEAVRKVRDGHYDLVLMDLQMPHMDGITACRMIRRIMERRGREFPAVVALTASSLDEHRQRAFQAGMQSFLSKPVSPGTLRKTVATILA